MFGGYWPASCPSPGCVATVDKAIAIDTVLLGTPLEYSSVASVSSLVGSSLPRPSSAGFDAALSTSPVPKEATPAASQPTLTPHNSNYTQTDPNLISPSLLFLSPTVVVHVSSLPTALTSHALPIAVSSEPSFSIVSAAHSLPFALTPTRVPAI